MLLTLDLATTTGWCAGGGDVLPTLGHVTMPDTKEEVGPFLDFFDRWLHMKLTELLEDTGLELEPSPYGPVIANPEERATIMVGIEAPMLPKARIDDRGHLKQAPTTIATTRKLQGLAGVAEMVCYRRKVEIREVYLQTVKKELSGSGRGAKPDMMLAAKRCGLAPKCFDEADAFGVWLVMVRLYRPAFQQLWDQKLWGGRGLL